MRTVHDARGLRRDVEVSGRDCAGKRTKPPETCKATSKSARSRLMTAREILRRPGFAPLATTYGLSELGDWLTTIALSVLVYDATGSAIATTLLFVCSKFLPAFVAPAVTARIDGVAPRRSLPLLYVLEAVGFAGMAVYAGVVPALVVLAAICGGAALVARALTRAAVAATLAGED